MQSKEEKPRDERYFLSIEDGKLVCSWKNPAYDDEKKPEEQPGVEPSRDTNVPFKDLPANHPYISPCPYKMPIMGFTAIKGKLNGNESAQREIMSTFKECGFNTLCEYTGEHDPGETYSFKNLKEWFDSICYVGTKLVVSYSGLFVPSKSNAKSAIEDSPDGIKDTFIDNNMLAAWFRDEPTVKACCEIMQRYEELIGIYPEIMCLINLSASTNEANIGFNDSYSGYLDIIQTAFQPAVWSYDYYPVRYSNSKWIESYDGGSHDMCPGLTDPIKSSVDLTFGAFYVFLEKMSRISKRTLRPFWAFCESQSHFSFRTEDGKYVLNAAYPPATLAYLRFEAFSSLAYGAQGILYYTYWYHPNSNVCSALLDEKGDKTPAWHAARQVNSEIRAYEEVFLGAEMVSCRHLGETPKDGQGEIQLNEMKLEFPFGPLDNLTIPAGGEGVLVSQLHNGCRRFLVVVSHSIKSSQRIQMLFSKFTEVTELTPTPLTSLSTPGSSSVARTLPPGGYLIFEYR